MPPDDPAAPTTAGADLAAIAAAAAADAGGLDVDLLGDFLATVVTAAQSGRPLEPAVVERYTRHGAAAAQAGVPLRALIDLYLSASWRLWTALPVVATGSADAVRAAGLAVLHAADDGVAALAEGFQLARADLVRRQDAEQREVFEALLAGGPVAEDVLGRARELGVDLSGPHAVVVARPRAVPGAAGEDEDGAGDAGEREVARRGAGAAAAALGRLERALAGRLGDAQPLVAVHEGQLVAVVAAPDARAVDEVVQRSVAVLVPGPRLRWQLAVGRAHAGPGAVRLSYEQARDALEITARLGLTATVATSADLALYRVLLRDRAAIAELVDTVLGPLAGARGGAVPLLETLEAYYACGATVTETARRLHLSPRAVSYRLTRITQLLDRDPTDPGERLAVHAAVTAARLLDWPAVPLDPY